jgi:hypothetical protein
MLCRRSSTGFSTASTWSRSHDDGLLVLETFETMNDRGLRLNGLDLLESRASVRRPWRNSAAAPVGVGRTGVDVAAMVA